MYSHKSAHDAIRNISRGIRRAGGDADTEEEEDDI